jgi:hypothetical protein
MSLWFALLIGVVGFGPADAGLGSESLRQMESHEDCDIPAAGFASSKAKDAADCSNQCIDNLKCQAFVFVSGWNRCFLKDSVRVVKGIQMFAGGVERVVGKDPVVQAFGAMKDHRGKDLRNIPQTRSEESCQQHCLTEKACVGYVWISGYDSCWLKKTKGAALDKRFYCGTIAKTRK